MIITETKTIKYDSNCKRNPVFVSWLNTIGGREHWLFDHTQIESLTTSRNGTFENYIQNLATARGKTKDFQMNASPQLTVFAWVDDEDVDGLMTLTYSLDVEMLLNPESWETDGLKWMKIRPLPGTFQIRDKRKDTSLIEITFDLPYINTQSR